MAYCIKCGHYTRRRLAALGGWCKGAHTPRGELTSAYRLYIRTIRRGIHPTISRYKLGKQYKPQLGFSPSSDRGSLESDMKAANLCLLRPPILPDAETLQLELREIEELEQAAAEAEASMTAAEWADEDEAWFNQDFSL
jgi:hypothetical protein